MTKKYWTEINGFTAKSLEWEGKFDLSIYKGNEEVYRNLTFAYSLKDCSTIIRRELGLKGKRINWISES